MKKGLIWIALLILVVLLAATALAQVSGGFNLGWYLFSAGGGHRSSTHYQVDDTVGQWAAGRSISDRYQIDAGFWSAEGRPEPWRLFMPVAVGNDQPGSIRQSAEQELGH